MIGPCRGNFFINLLKSPFNDQKNCNMFITKSYGTIWKRQYGMVNIERLNCINEKKSMDRKIFTQCRNITSSSRVQLNKNNERDFFEGEPLNRTLGGYGYPMMFIVTYDKPSWQPFWENDCEVIPRDEFGVPASIPPEISTQIKHTYYVPPQFYTFLKKLGDDTEELRPYMIKLIKGEFTYDDYQEMFYKFAKPLKIFRKKIPVPYRSAEEMANEEEMKWQSAWYTYRQKVLAEYNVTMCLREFILYMTVGLYFAYLWLDALRQYRLDMKLFYLEAPEHKINWVKPRGDLV
ncbi:cytochrome c oxidase subunit ApiCOX35 [Plasmodium brasilianum]|uniref:Uncharacterized protein n=2 Tax=Plasmodium (Plasmodium) TaxID=418103 RepID=A0A1A8VZZ3_PLAMA|nr:conserved Plasmodium protein, unknown function [Plasmodium malariae]KAI4839015.1 cytochrome c oxidase subunit ApiCOX35 [Plasmodium brasilianum]SBS84961.1 conserved Plasmodium protein, unknown function [Plasmodium malariae]SCN12367.1 conserved Plasmodium protein, unknown function [Plasmodium malariae]